MFGGRFFDSELRLGVVFPNPDIVGHSTTETNFFDNNNTLCNCYADALHGVITHDPKSNGHYVAYSPS